MELVAQIDPQRERVRRVWKTEGRNLVTPRGPADVLVISSGVPPERKMPWLGGRLILAPFLSRLPPTGKRGKKRRRSACGRPRSLFNLWFLPDELAGDRATGGGTAHDPMADFDAEAVYFVYRLDKSPHAG